MLTSQASLVHDCLYIAELVMRFGEVERVTRHPGGTFETDTTHTVMLALVAQRVTQDEEVPLDVQKVLVFALVHDLVEAYAGDVSTIRPLDAATAANKARRERSARNIIVEQAPWLGELIDAYHRQDTDEALFVRHLDKVLPKLTHAHNRCQVQREHGITKAELEVHQAEQGAALAAAAPHLTVTAELFRRAARVAENAYGDDYSFTDDEIPF